MRLLSSLLTMTIILAGIPASASAGTGLFDPPVDYTAGSAPHDLTLGDLDNDLDLDLVVTNYWTGRVVILRGNGDGTFQTVGFSDVFERPNTLALADFNNDGDLDLVVSNNAGTNEIATLLGNGDCSFQAPTFHTIDWTSYTVVTADFDADGNQDVAASSRYWGYINLLMGNGDGTFLAPTAFVSGTEPTSMAVGDMNGDGMPDLATAHVGTTGGNPDFVAIHLGNGDGTFQPHTAYDGGQDPGEIALADFNGDSHLDAVVTNVNSDQVTVLPGNGDGTLQAGSSWPVGDRPVDLVADDFDGDTFPDIVTVNTDSIYISVLIGNGDFSFQPTCSIELSHSKRCLGAGDLNGDQAPDLACSWGEVSVLINATATAGTVSAGLDCTPATGTLPVPVLFSVSLVNHYPEMARTVAGRINIDLANGQTVSGWRAGSTNIWPGSPFQAIFGVTLPDIGALSGENRFTLLAEDVTPAPYNQPPYPPAGYRDSSECVVEGICP